MKKYITIIFVLFLFAGYAKAQENNSNIWYFGQFAGIDFNPGNPVARTDGQLDTWEGCASICDQSGRILFYTDGRTVYNRNNEIMSNGTGLDGAYSSSQSSIIVPKPHQSGGNVLYYIFTTDCWEHDLAGGFRYSVVDMSLEGGLGAVTSEKNVLIHDKVGEKLAAIHHANGLDVWVMVHDWGSNNYLAYKLTVDGLEMTPVISPIGAVYTGDYQMGAGQLRFSENGVYAACSMNYYYRLDLMKFDPSTGLLSDLIYFQDEDAFLRVWGLEFSRNEHFLYFSKRPPDILCQLDLQDWNYSAILSSKKVIESTSGSSGDYDAGTLQMGPDDKIYLTRYDKSYLSVINAPDEEGEACDFKENGVDLEGRLGKWGLPNLMRSYFKADFTWQPDCDGDTVWFNLVYTGSVDSIRWSFGDTLTGDNNISVGLTPFHIFSSSGSFVVTATLYIGGNPYVIQKEVVVKPLPSVNLGPDTTICSNQPFILHAGTGFDSYLWQDGSADSLLQVDTSGVYWVTVENECGSATDSVAVDYKATFNFDLGSDTSFCYGNTIQLSPGGNFTSYLWQNGSTDSTLVANASGIYWVQVTDSAGCSATDSLQVETYMAFDFSIGDDTTICEGDYIFLNGPDGYESYQWQDGSDFTSLIADTAGYYWLEITDTNRCAARDSLLLTVNIIPDDILGSDTLFCEGGNFTLSTNPAYSQYFWQDGSNNPTYTINTPGKYWVTVIDTLGCTGSDTIYLDYFDPVKLELQSEGYLCDDDSVILQAISNYNNYLWQDSSQSQTYIAKDSGVYWVKVSTPCETKADSITFDACSSIWIPNVFTPNNDGFNDYFYAIGKNIPQFKMEIFNRWGQTLKVLHSIDEKWDGTYRGQKAAEGTYFWVADYEQVNRDGSTKHIRLQGSVTLLR